MVSVDTKLFAFCIRVLVVTKLVVSGTQCKFDYNEHHIIVSRYLCIKLTDCDVKKFCYDERPLITSSLLLLVSGTQCNAGLPTTNHQVSIIYDESCILKANQFLSCTWSYLCSNWCPYKYQRCRLRVWPRCLLTARHWYWGRFLPKLQQPEGKTFKTKYIAHKFFLDILSLFNVHSAIFLHCKILLGSFVFVHALRTKCPK